MKTRKDEIREEAIKRLIARHFEEFAKVIRSLEAEVRKHGGILK